MCSNLHAALTSLAFIHDNMVDMTPDSNPPPTHTRHKVWALHPQGSHLAMPLAVLALLADPVDGVEVVVGPHPRDRLLQEVQQVGGGEIGRAACRESV